MCTVVYTPKHATCLQLIPDMEQYDIVPDAHQTQVQRELRAQQAQRDRLQLLRRPDVLLQRRRPRPQLWPQGEGNQTYPLAGTSVRQLSVTSSGCRSLMWDRGDGKLKLRLCSAPRTSLRI